ncbi:MAG: GPR endopeptidase [Defluviitaleaceae bacterium]|nr:GPR endopeptidase [Defluviitaleaceae bacterium]
MRTNKNTSIRTDLAIEMREHLCGHSDTAIPGVEITMEQDEALGATVTWVQVTNKAGAQAMGKPIGNYITLEANAIKENAPEAHEAIVKILARKLGRLHQLPPDATVLVVGLGNRHVTPDALGPKVCEKLLVTRHIGQEVPQDLAGRLRAVCALSPGVMGITGIETAEIVKGVVEKTCPDLVIAIDALAARRTSRINATIQISDAGINPGAGLGNKRMAINQDSMGVPVVAIGVPTVVDAATLVNDTMEKMLDAMAEAAPKGDLFYNMLADMQTVDRYGLITEILDPYTGNMFVTPKEVDAVIGRLSKIIADTLNIALHPGITTEDVGRYIEPV